MRNRQTDIQLRGPIIAMAIALAMAVLVFVDSDAANTVIALVAAPAVAALLGRRAARACGPMRTVWLLLMTHMLLLAAGDASEQLLRWIDDTAVRTVSMADLFYLLAYLPLIMAIVRLAAALAQTRVPDLLIDAAAVAVVAGLGIWQVLVVGPGTLASGTLSERIVNGAYPLADILAVGALAALVFARTLPSRIVGAVGVYGALDLLLDLIALLSSVASTPVLLVGLINSAYTVTYGVLAVVALLPDEAPAIPGPDARPPGAVPRLSLLGIAVCCAPALAIILAFGKQPTWVPLLVAGALAVSILVMTRVAGLVRRLEDEQRRLSATEAHLEFQASHDALTGLPNRALLTSRLAEEVERATDQGREIALMFIDLDDFKIVNDTLGHAAGDDLLRVIGKRIQDEMSPGDIVGRVGGDEFVVVSSNLTDRRLATRFAERVLTAVAAPVQIVHQMIEPSVSIGIALRGASSDPQVLLANADLALYKAKDSGRCCARVFDQSLRLAADERVGIETGLRRAVGQDEISVEYQPRVDLRTGQVASLEALARWNARPDIPVWRFIEVAEHSGIVDQLGRNVLNRACRDIVRINQTTAGAPVGVSVNVSMRQLMQPDLVGTVADALHTHGVPHDLLTLEITETFVAQEPELAASTLADIRGLGVRIEIDDFGVGHTSFTSLSSMPIDGIKIDRSLVLGLAHDEATESIVAAIVAMARALRLQTTVEGIESADDLGVLRALGCDLGQGYLFSRSVPFETAQRLVATWPGLCPAAAMVAGDRVPARLPVR